MMSILLLLILLKFMSISISNANNANQKRSKYWDAWKFEMVQNLSWNMSKNFMFVYREKTTVNGDKHIGKYPPKEFEDADMSFPFLMNQDNMLIQFYTKYPEIASCHIGIFPEEKVHTFVTEMTETAKNTKCQFERKNFYITDVPARIQKMKLYAFCLLDSALEQKFGKQAPNWVKARGEFIPPSQTPQCIYDFHHRAREKNEYDFFKYCAKGYFFQGKDRNDPKRHSEYRKDWLLFLAEGKITCGISGNIEADNALLAKGYSVELEQLSAPYRFYPEMRLCPELSATLVKYEDHRKDGAFFLGAVVGSAQLQGKFTWKYAEFNVSVKEPNANLSKTKDFWDVGTYKTEYEKMALDERACYLQYHKLMKWNYGPLIGAYRLQLRITHFCSGRGLRTQTSFDVSVKPNQPPDNIYEDKWIQINLSKGILTRSTGQKLCAIEYGNAPGMEDCIKAPEPQKNLQLKEQDKCRYSHDCGFGMLCRDNNNKSLSCQVTDSGGLYDSKCKATGEGNRTCEYFHWNWADPNHRTGSRCNIDKKNCKCEFNDLSCHDDHYCSFKDEVRNECKFQRFRQENEPCLVDAECFPDSKCVGGNTDPKKLGYCTI